MNIVEKISAPNLFTLVSSSWHIWYVSDLDWMTDQSHVNRQPSQCKDVINYHDLPREAKKPSS